MHFYLDPYHDMVGITGEPEFKQGLILRDGHQHKKSTMILYCRRSQPTEADIMESAVSQSWFEAMYDEISEEEARKLDPGLVDHVRAVLDNTGPWYNDRILVFYVDCVYCQSNCKGHDELCPQIVDNALACFVDWVNNGWACRVELHHEGRIIKEWGKVSC